MNGREDFNPIRTVEQRLLDIENRLTDLETAMESQGNVNTACLASVKQLLVTSLDLTKKVKAMEAEKESKIITLVRG